MRILLYVVASAFLFCSCQRTGNQTWENIKTAGRYVNKGFDTICGKDIEYRLIENEEDFFGPEDDDFIPLHGKDLNIASKKQPTKGTQGKVTGGKYQNPVPQVASIFRPINFAVDDHVIHDKNDLLTISRIAAYMKKHNNCHLLIEGHCDETASAAYNMSLGTRRANHIRVLLIRQGVAKDRIATVSFGKEKPIASGHTRSDWQKNRRAEFKLSVR